MGILLSIALALLLVACGDQQDATRDSASTDTTAPPGAPAAVTADRSAAVAEGERVDQDLVIVLRDAVQIPATSKQRPLARVNALIHAGDGSARMFAVEMDGVIHVIERDKLMPVPFLDVARERGKAFVHNDTEKGLASLAFHPDYARTGAPGFGRVYTASTESADSGVPDFATPDPGGKVSHHDVIAEWRVDAQNGNRIDPASRREVLRIAHPLRDHTIGQIAFNPNTRPGDADHGMLYVGVGDGGNTVPTRGEVDAMRTAQNTLVPFGKIIRINPLQNGARKYSVPPDNPFVSKPKFIKEIWAYGLRNPQRFCWDTGGNRRMIIVDIGQAQAEEVNIGLAGSNYGWSEREGTFAVNHRNEKEVSGLPPNDAALGYIYPALQYRHDLGRAITGGYVYRGRLIPALQGKYVFGDIASGRIFFTDAARLVNGKAAKFSEIKLMHAGRQKTLLEILDNDSRADLRFGLDAAGEIYVLTKRDGMIRKFSMAEPRPQDAGK